MTGDAFIRTPSVAFREGENDAIKRVLATVEIQAEKRVRDGFSEVNFTAGVLNCFFILLMFNAYPEHFWIVYLVEAAFLFPTKFLAMIRSKPLNNAFYYFDLCWFMNFSGVIAFALMFAGKQQLSDEFRRQLFFAAYGTSCGPLLGACGALSFVALVFHNVDSMTSVFIHFFPPLLFYVLKWRADDVANAWPNAFDLDYEIVFWPQGSFTGCVFGNTVILYFAWFVPYLLWQIFIGLDLPRSSRRTKLRDGTTAIAKYDTVFHSTMRGGLCITMGKALWGRSKEVSMEQMRTNDFELKDFLFYMGAHCVSAIGAIVVLAYPCYLSRYVHAAFLFALGVLCVHRGSKRYTYYSTKMYGKMIRKHFADEINREPQPSNSNSIASDTSQLNEPKVKHDSYHKLAN